MVPSDTSAHPTCSDQRNENGTRAIETRKKKKAKYRTRDVSDTVSNAAPDGRCPGRKAFLVLARGGEAWMTPCRSCVSD